MLPTLRKKAHEELSTEPSTGATNYFKGNTFRTTRFLLPVTSFVARSPRFWKIVFGYAVSLTFYLFFLSSDLNMYNRVKHTRSLLKSHQKLAECWIDR